MGRLLLHVKRIMRPINFVRDSNSPVTTDDPADEGTKSVPPIQQGYVQSWELPTRHCEADMERSHEVTEDRRAKH